MLIAFAENAYTQGVNYQRHVLFVGQDVDATVARMVYLQLSLLSCAGYVAVGDSLSNPFTGDALSPNKSNHDVWFTPMYFRKEWEWRRVWKQVGKLTSPIKAEKV